MTWSKQYLQSLIVERQVEWPESLKLFDSKVGRLSQKLLVEVFLEEYLQLSESQWAQVGHLQGGVSHLEQPSLLLSKSWLLKSHSLSESRNFWNEACSERLTFEISTGESYFSRELWGVIIDIFSFRKCVILPPECPLPWLNLWVRRFLTRILLVNTTNFCPGRHSQPNG